MNETANYIDPSHDSLFETRLTPMARAAGAVELANFVQMLKTKRPAHLQRAVAEAMMIHETSFFRDFSPFELLRRSVVPKLMERKRKERRLTIWSAASSTGQEPYSLAMMLCEHFPKLADWDVRIVATDISESSQEYARRGCYRRSEVNRGLPARMLVKYFSRDGDEWQINEKIRSMVEFCALNLRAPLAMLEKFDLVLLRNVLLYFPEKDRSAVLTDVHRMMHSHGMLLLGNAEQAEDSTDLFRVVLEAGCYYYRPLEDKAQ